MKYRLWPKIYIAAMICIFPMHSHACEIKSFFSPNGRAQDAIIKEIQNAKTSVHVGAYVFTSQPIALALEAAKLRGLDVRAVVDGKQSKQTKKYLQGAAFPIRYDYKYAIFHNKFIIIDQDEVLTGSFNFTKSADIKNAENLNVIKGCNIGQVYEDKWQQYWKESQ